MHEGKHLKKFQTPKAGSGVMMEYFSLLMQAGNPSWGKSYSKNTQGVKMFPPAHVWGMEL